MLHFPGYVISDVDGTHLSCDQSWEGMKVEVGSMSLQEVGRVLKQDKATQLCKEWDIVPITCGWVSAQKDADNVRTRMVAREIARGQLHAKDLQISSPTSSIESLRLMLPEAAVQDLTILGLDVSAAFTASPLGRKLGNRIRVVLKFPPSITHKDGSPVFLEAWKAINGLRSSGRAWVDHLSPLLQRLNIVPSPVESTVFAGEIDGKNLGFRWLPMSMTFWSSQLPRSMSMLCMIFCQST